MIVPITEEKKVLRKSQNFHSQEHHNIIISGSKYERDILIGAPSRKFEMV
jgi:hypothetical protein